jgi:hypothetical protein
VVYQVAVRGAQLDVSGGDLPQPVTLQRRGGGAAAAAPAKAAAGGIAGIWLYNNGQYSLELGADGSGKFNGNALHYKYAGSTLTITAANGQSMTYKAVVQGDTLQMSGGDLPGIVTMTRGTEGAGAQAASDPTGLAGVYSHTESSVDPSIAIVITQYITLYPDGTVGYQKTEGGGSQTQLTQNWARFRSWHQGGPALGNAGRWQSDGSTITVNFSWGKVSQGRVDAAGGRIELSRTGILEEGATLIFKREQ